MHHRVEVVVRLGQRLPVLGQEAQPHRLDPRPGHRGRPVPVHLAPGAQVQHQLQPEHVDQVLDVARRT